jgi:hypothetical protein
VLGSVGAGCAPTRLPAPVAITCQALHLASVVDPESRVEFPAWGYSVLPPRGANWCVGGRTPRGTIFNTHPLLGKLIDEKPAPNDILHTFGLMTTADDVPKDARFATPEEMFAFVDQRFLRPEPRFTVVESSFRPDASLGAECIRFDAVIEERNNPDARGAVFVGVLRDNVLCRHPRAPTPTLVLISASERYVQGAVAGPLLIDALRGEWEPSVRSLRFQPRP